MCCRSPLDNVAADGSARCFDRGRGFEGDECAMVAWGPALVISGGGVVAEGSCMTGSGSSIAAGAGGVDATDSQAVAPDEV